MRRFAQKKAAGILIPRSLLATDPGRPHQVERRVKLNFDPEITATVHGKTNENTGVFRMRRNSFPHLEVRRSVDAGYSEGIDLNRCEYGDRGYGGRLGQREPELISGNQLQRKTPEFQTIFGVATSKATDTMRRDIPVRLRQMS